MIVCGIINQKYTCQNVCIYAGFTDTQMNIIKILLLGLVNHFFLNYIHSKIEQKISLSERLVQADVPKCMDKVS